MSRGVVPPGKAGLLIVAAVIVPAAAKKLKPLAKWTGKSLVKVGEFVQKLADEAGTAIANADSKDNVNDETTKVDTTAADVEVTTSSPIGQEEIEAQAVAEAVGDGATPDPAPAPKRKHRKKSAPEQKLNPKKATG